MMQSQNDLDTSIQSDSVHILALETSEREEYRNNNEEAEEVRYDAVLVPHPGVNVDGVRLKDENARVNDIATTKTSSILTRFKEHTINQQRRFTNSDKNSTHNQREDDTSITITNSADNTNTTTAQREASSSCAICLTYYSPSDVISWSSTDCCTHVFHRDCIVEWLVQMGKIKSAFRSFSEVNPKDEELLDYGLECACCRAEFISKDVLLSEKQSV